MSERKRALSFQRENLRKTDCLEGTGVDDDDDDDDTDLRHQADMVLGHLLTPSGLTPLKSFFNGLPWFLLLVGL